MHRGRERDRGAGRLRRKRDPSDGRGGWGEGERALQGRGFVQLATGECDGVRVRPSHDRIERIDADPTVPIRGPGDHDSVEDDVEGQQPEWTSPAGQRRDDRTLAVGDRGDRGRARAQRREGSRHGDRLARRGPEVGGIAIERGGHAVRSRQRSGAKVRGRSAVRSGDRARRRRSWSIEREGHGLAGDAEAIGVGEGRGQRDPVAVRSARWCAQRQGRVAQWGGYRRSRRSDQGVEGAVVRRAGDQRVPSNGLDEQTHRLRAGRPGRDRAGVVPDEVVRVSTGIRPRDEIERAPRARRGILIERVGRYDRLHAGIDRAADRDVDIDLRGIGVRVHVHRVDDRRCR